MDRRGDTAFRILGALAAIGAMFPIGIFAGMFLGGPCPHLLGHRRRRREHAAIGILALTAACGLARGHPAPSARVEGPR